MSKPFHVYCTPEDTLDALPPEDIYIYYLEGWIKPEYENFVDFSSDLVIANIHYDITRRLMDTKDS